MEDLDYNNPDELAKRNEEEFKKSFDLLVKNRNVICDSEGRLYGKNARYFNKYVILINKTSALGMVVAGDALRYCYFPNTPTGEACCKDIEAQMQSIRAEMKDILIKGTYEGYMDKIKTFATKAKEIYWSYVSKGMHKEVIAS